MEPLAGRLWWSFYESDATFENFVTRSLAYVARTPLEEVEELSFPEREDSLLAHLDREPHLLVLDGLERVLVAYARGDAPYLRDDAVEAGTELAVSSPRHALRRTTDPRVGVFLRKLLTIRHSRILASSRLFPADLETTTGQPLPGADRLALDGLSDDDALELWRALGARASREALLPLVEKIGRHPLLLQVLAGEVARFREAPGDFDAWRRAHPDFDPFSLPLAKAQTHLLEHALSGLPPEKVRALQVLAGFRMPVGFDTVKSLLLASSEEEADAAGAPFADLPALDRALTDLEDRGLVGWDPRANRYDLHPIVRGVVWSRLGRGAKRGVLESLRSHFEAVPMVEDWKEVESLEDLAPAIELFHTLIGLGRFEEAFRLFRDRDAGSAQPLADRAWELAHVHRHERDFIRAARLQGTAALHLDDLPTAGDRLHHALARSRTWDVVEEQLPTLTALAELALSEGDGPRARDLLDQVWDPAERGPYPLFHADALNLLARIEADAGHPDAAAEAATRALELAWCDGPPFAYQWGLEAARAHLGALGAAEPELPPFDPSKFEPMPKVEIDPLDGDGDEGEGEGEGEL